MRIFFRAGQVVILVFCLGLTVLIATHEGNHSRAEARLRFNAACDEIQFLILERFDDFTRVLHAGAAFFDTSETVSRHQWKVFTTALDLGSDLPGIQSIGYSLLIQPDQLARNTGEIRAEGFPSYMVWPEGPRPIYSSIIYLEPFAGQNLRAFGYDMFSEPVRRSAMEDARDTGLPRLSGIVRLVQETKENPQPGILLYLPVYKQGMPTGTIGERRAAIMGWVYSPYRLNDQMNSVLAAWTAKYHDQQLSLQIHLGGAGSDSSLLFDSGSISGEVARPRGSLSKTSTVNMAGLEWTLGFSNPRGATFKSDNSLFWFILLMGILISLLLFSVFHVLLRTRNQAQRIAARLTADLRSSEEKYRIIFDNEVFAICIFDLETLKIIDVNESFTRLYGFGREELVDGMTIDDVSTEAVISTAQAQDKATSFIPLRWHRKKDGTIFPVEIVGGSYSWQGRPVMFAMAHDIGDRLAIEAALRVVSEEKRTLLSELQHRVKNSFNMISALVSLSAEEAESAEARDTLGELEGRVRTISQLYALLYQSGSFSELRLDTYCLEVVSAVSAFKGMIHFRTEMEELSVKTPIAVPIALILTELLTNSIKYAFPGDHPGQVLVSLRRTEVGAELIVRDDGVGLPSGFDHKNHAGMGMKLIHGLSGQIGGGFSMKGADTGTSSILTFPLEE